jgi:NAD(P)H-dependent flavin oxidoreductase YrpB (nitropropane dioxygenase family)
MTWSLATPLCDLLGIELPVVQAPIGSATCPELAAAVSGAGALGTLALTWTAPDRCSERIRRTQALTDRPFAVNLVLDWDHRDRIEICARERVALISTFWGDPAPYVELIHGAGSLHIHTVGSAAEALAAAEAGVDVIVAQGAEAGGHVRGATSTLTLVPAVVDAVRPIPVIAAGGIADARGLVAVLALGAQAAWIGTRFLLAAEANVHAAYRNRVIAARAEDTVHTSAFDGGWPDAAHRVLRNATLTAWEAAGRPASPHRPGEGEIVATAPSGVSLERYHMAMPQAGTGGDVEEMALYAGQGVGLARACAPAAEIVGDLRDGALALLGSSLPTPDVTPSGPTSSPG